jgi:hypothetical protein
MVWMILSASVQMARPMPASAMAMEPTQLPRHSLLLEIGRTPKDLKQMSDLEMSREMVEQNTVSLLQVVISPAGETDGSVSSSDLHLFDTIGADSI